MVQFMSERRWRWWRVGYSSFINLWTDIQRTSRIGSPIRQRYSLEQLILNGDRRFDEFTWKNNAIKKLFHFLSISITSRDCSHSFFIFRSIRFNFVLFTRLWLVAMRVFTFFLLSMCRNPDSILFN